MHEREVHDDGDMSRDAGPDSERTAPQPSQVRLPGFVTDEDIGLGDLAKRAIGAVGIRPCRSCSQRAAALNRWLVISGRSSRRR